MRTQTYSAPSDKPDHVGDAARHCRVTISAHAQRPPSWQRRAGRTGGWHRSGFERFERVGGEFPGEFDHRGGALKVQGAARVVWDGDEDIGREAGEAVAVDDALHGLACVGDHVLPPDSDRTKSRRCRPATPFCTTASRPPRLLRRPARPQPPLRARSGTARRSVRSEVVRQRRRAAPAATLAAHGRPGGTAALAVAGLRSSARRYKAGPARFEVNVFGVAAANRFAP
jgi:hypothetical protein